MASASITTATKNKETTKIVISYISFLAAITIGFIALFVPPVGIINSSVLWFTAQLLLFVAALLGIQVSFGQYGHTHKTEEEQI